MAAVDDYLRHSYAIRLWEPHSKSYSYLTLIRKGAKYPGAHSEALTLQVATEGQQEKRYIREIVFGKRRAVQYWQVTTDPETLPPNSTSTCFWGTLERTKSGRFDERIIRTSSG